MIEARYPNGLPYFQHWVTVDTVARHHGLSVGSFAQSVSPSFPYFFQTQAWSNDAGPDLAYALRSVQRRGGTACVRPCRSRGEPLSTKKTNYYLTFSMIK